jgi:hypothetical protein
MGDWSPLGGFTPMDDPNTVVIGCLPLLTYPAPGPNTRPAKGGTAMGEGKGGTMTMTFRVAPVYRNPGFFTPSGQPNHVACIGTSTGVWTSTQTRFGADKGKVQRGNPVAGSWNVVPTPNGLASTAGFTIPPAPATGSLGIRTTGLIGEVANDYPYIYSYTYGTIRNDQGTFGPGQGPGSFNYRYTLGTPNSYGASIMQKAGKAKFGGTMKMLGALTTKVCYWLQAGPGGCSLGVHNWRYDAIGASVTSDQTSGGVVTMGAIYTHYERYYNTRQGNYSGVLASGARFPWTTGSLTVTAVARGPHKTVHYAKGYDNRDSLGKGTIQLVSPVLTRWFGYADYETGGIGVLRIKFVPEPQTWAILIAGVSLLGVGFRMRGR